MSNGEAVPHSLEGAPVQRGWARPERYEATGYRRTKGSRAVPNVKSKLPSSEKKAGGC